MNFTEQTVGDLLDKVSSKYPNKEIIVLRDKNIRYSYSQFINMCNELAKGLLCLGIKKGEHVAIWSQNNPEWIALQVATAKIGAVLVCLNTSYGESDFEFTLNHSEATTLFLSKGLKDNEFIEMLYSTCPEIKHSEKGKLTSNKFPYLKNIISIDDVDSSEIFKLSEIISLGKNITEKELNLRGSSLKPYDVINIQYTSGTTGNPKAVMSNHYAIINNAIAVGNNLSYNEQDKLLICMPLFHVMGCVLSAVICLLYGATMVIVERFQTKKVLEYLDEEKCTALNGVPTMFKFLLEYPELKKYDLSCLNKGMMAGSKCSPDLILKTMDDMNMKNLTIVYGQTEALGITQTLPSDSIDKRIQTVGKGLPGVRFKIIDPKTGGDVSIGTQGELCVQTEYVMNGYYKNDEATKKALDDENWLHTGDLAIMDEDGYITLIGRIKEIIIRGGENISPIEIEELLMMHPSIKEASVVGIPDKDLGEEICATIILEKNHKLTDDEIRQFVKKNLAKYKIPKYVVFMNEFPVTASGKVKKHILKKYIVDVCNLTA